MVEERFESQFGTLAVEKGFITLDQLIDAIQMQLQENIESGNCRFIGSILFDHKLITIPQIDSVLSTLGKITN